MAYGFNNDRSKFILSDSGIDPATIVTTEYLQQVTGEINGRINSESAVRAENEARIETALNQLTSEYGTFSYNTDHALTDLTSADTAHETRLDDLDVRVGRNGIWFNAWGNAFPWRTDQNSIYFFVSGIDMEGLNPEVSYQESIQAAKLFLLGLLDSITGVDLLAQAKANDPAVASTMQQWNDRFPLNIQDITGTSCGLSIRAAKESFMNGFGIGILNGGIKPAASQGS